MKNKFLDLIKEKGVEEPVIYMLITEDSYFDVYDFDLEDYVFKDANEAWEYINSKCFGKFKLVEHKWIDTDLAKFVWYIEKFDEYYSAIVPYSSYEGYYTEDIRLERVYPKEKLITVYE